MRNVPPPVLPEPSGPGDRDHPGAPQGHSGAAPATRGHAAAAGKAESALLILSMVLVGLLPLLLYALLFAGVPTVAAPAARQRLAATPATTVLVDLRDPQSYARGHVPSAYNWPYTDFQQWQEGDLLPAPLREHQLFLLCDTGLRSALATRRLRAFSLPATHIHGGMQAWIATAAASGDLTLTTGAGAGPLLLARSLTGFEQTVTVTASLVIKPIYMGAALLLIVLLWTRPDPDLAFLRWGLIFFLAGEVACVFNTVAYFLNGEQSDLFEYLHGLGMVLCLGCLAFALIVGLDRRLLNLSHPRRRCALLPLCRRCVKLQDVPCRLQRAFLFMLPLFGALSFISLAAQLDDTSYNAALFGLPYNFTHPGIHQFYEIRYLPLVTLFLLALSFLLLSLPRADALALARVPFATAAGALGYSLLMLALYAVYRHNLVWFIFWEEATELLLIAAIAALLWVFRGTFFPDDVKPLPF